MKKKIIGNILLTLILIGSYYVYVFTTDSGKIPHNPPKTVIKYNGKAVPTSFGAQCWINNASDNGADYNDEYGEGLKTPKFNAKAGDKLRILIPRKPLSVEIYRIKDSKYTDYKSSEYTPPEVQNEYIFTLPTEKGEYVFNVCAEWDKNKHNTATIFRVIVE